MQICTVALSFMERMPTNQALKIPFFSEHLWHNNLPYSPSFDIPFQLQYVCEILVTWTYLNDTNDFAITKASAARAFGLVTRRSWVLLMLGK